MIRPSLDWWTEVRLIHRARPSEAPDGGCHGLAHGSRRAGLVIAIAIPCISASASGRDARASRRPCPVARARSQGAHSTSSACPCRSAVEAIIAVNKCHHTHSYGWLAGWLAGATERRAQRSGADRVQHTPPFHSLHTERAPLRLVECEHATHSIVGASHSGAGRAQHCDLRALLFHFPPKLQVDLLFCFSISSKRPKRFRGAHFQFDSSVATAELSIHEIRAQ